MINLQSNSVSAIVLHKQDCSLAVRWPKINTVDDYLIFCAISHFDYSCHKFYYDGRLLWIFISIVNFRIQLLGYDSSLQRTLFSKLGSTVTQLLTWNQKTWLVFYSFSLCS